ncbi:cupin domain-containing protein [Sandarakinorhabdus sp. AAP62]|uniref:cupin domain-containing protein n=1 Tax=Sandarakinorhabdus sp. AAP62 TaxID=1248916 RepID=UPI0002DD6543|nr:cupin domain-containing protein [Sandarakinorhabdus sp. AAP62]
MPQIEPTATDDAYVVLGETLRPMLTNAMGSAIEIFDTTGTPGGGPPPHTHKWEEVYIVLSGEMDVHVDGATRRLHPGDYAHVPANTPHGYTTIDETRFLTIVTRGNAARFFKQVSSEVEMNPPDIPGVVRVGAENGINFLP